jgi:hypothetical protein
MRDRDNSERFATERADRDEYPEIPDREDGRASARFNTVAPNEAENEMTGLSRDRWEGLPRGCATDEGY